MQHSQKETLKNRLNKEISRINALLEKYDQSSRQLSYIRLGYFVVSVIALYAISKTGSDLFFFSALLALLGGFIFLVSRHRKITKHREKLSFLMAVKQEHVARIDLDWEKLPEKMQAEDYRTHPFAEDLNIVGKYSLHHLLDTAVYEGGSDRLKDWLLNQHPQKDEITKRQKLVKELKKLGSFRDRIQVNAFISRKELSDKDWSMEQLLKWMSQPKKVKFKNTLAILSALALANIILLFTAIAGITGPYVLLTFVTYLMVYNFNSHKISGLFDAAYQIDKQLKRFGSILLYIEEYDFRNASALSDFLDGIKNSGESPSFYLKKVARLGGAASLQKNQVLWPLVNMVMPWDMYFSMKMEALKTELEPKLSHWLDVFYDLEALNSLANFSALNPDYTFPEITQPEENHLKATDLGHPLIHYSEKVTNSFSVKRDKDLYLITGSNMAGKSTFLRTVGINLCLSFAGGPVNAAQLQTGLFRLFTSINVKDSLEQGLSHFYAEVRRLRSLLDALEEEQELPLFFFVDEIYKGTNNRERYQGGAAFLRSVAGKKGAGMVSTHDLELASLADEIPELQNWHFSETIENNKMSFEYTLKKGPCPTTNALKIMEIEGLPIK